jgi:hypothetical protein
VPDERGVSPEQRQVGEDTRSEDRRNIQADALGEDLHLFEYLRVAHGHSFRERRRPDDEPLRAERSIFRQA